MNDQACPKCGGEMDEGTVSQPEGINYFSNRQTGMFKEATFVGRARTCLTCGYLELYLDVESLKKKIR